MYRAHLDLGAMENTVKTVSESLQDVKTTMNRMITKTIDILNTAPFARGIPDHIGGYEREIESYIVAKSELMTQMDDLCARMYSMFQPYLSAIMVFERDPNESDSEGSSDEGSENEVDSSSQPIPVVIGNRPE